MRTRMSLALALALLAAAPALGAGPYDETVTAAPDARFVTTPDKRVVTTKRTVPVEFSFVSNEPRSRFECAREQGFFTPCSSPLDYRVGKGWHFIMVRAIDPDGNADESPDDYLFKVKRKRHL